jgi:general secretion pathway protein L
MSKLLVLLPAAPPGSTRPDDVDGLLHVLTEDGQTATRSAQASAALLPPADEVIAVVPPQMLSWHRVDLPRMPVARFAQGLASVLEDRLLCPPEQAHLVCQPGHKPGQAGTGVWVAACDRQWLKQALGALEIAGRRADRIAPLLAPNDAPLTLVHAVQGQAWASTRHEAGISSVPLSMVHALGLPATGRVVAEPALAAQASHSLEAGGSVVQVASASQMLMHALDHAWDFASGEFERRNPHGAQALTTALRHFWQDRSWRAARRALLATLAVQLLGLNVWAWQEQRTLTEKQARMQQILQQTFPGTPAVAEPHLLMQRETQALSGKTGQADPAGLEGMLALLGQFSPAATGPTELEYTPGKGVFRQMAAPAAASSGAFDQAAAQRGLKVSPVGSDLVLEAQQ